jgi:hypothetical protein
MLLRKLQYSARHALIHLNMPSVWAPCNLRTSSESVVWTQGSFRCGNRSFCKAITSTSVLPNILGRKICSCNNRHKCTSDNLNMMLVHTIYRNNIKMRFRGTDSEMWMWLLTHNLWFQNSVTHSILKTMQWRIKDCKEYCL